MTHKFIRNPGVAGSTRPSSRWLPATLLLAGGLTVAAVGYLYLHGPVMPAAANGGLVFGAAEGARDADHTGNASGTYARGNAAGQAGGAEMSAWEEERENELVEQRRATEMVANTPGVTPDQYVSEGDDSMFAKEGEEEE